MNRYHPGEMDDLVRRYVAEFGPTTPADSYTACWHLTCLLEEAIGASAMRSDEPLDDDAGKACASILSGAADAMVTQAEISRLAARIQEQERRLADLDPELTPATLPEVTS